MSRIAVVSASGIGDGLIVHIASHSLSLSGHQVVTFTNHLHQFGPWLSTYAFHRQPDLEEVDCCFRQFDAILLQHDNTPKAQKVLSLRSQLPIFTFYTNYRASKHLPLEASFDFVFDPTQTMVANVTAGLKHLFSIETDGAKNGLIPPPALLFKKYPRRVAIHPTSTDEEKNWPKEKFLRVAEWLTESGYEPVFVASPSERAQWNGPLLPTLADLASFLYQSGAFLGNDSGPGHIASYIGLPHLIIAKDEAQMKFWRPGWHPGEILAPASFLPNWKIFRKNWKKIITVNKVIKTLKNKVLRIK